jgi:hypothetical protein
MLAPASALLPDSGNRAPILIVPWVFSALPPFFADPDSRPLPAQAGSARKSIAMSSPNLARTQ